MGVSKEEDLHCVLYLQSAMHVLTDYPYRWQAVLQTEGSNQLGLTREVNRLQWA